MKQSVGGVLAVALLAATMMCLAPQAVAGCAPGARPALALHGF